MYNRLSLIVTVPLATMALLVSASTSATVLFYSTPFSVTDSIVSDVGASFSGTLSGSQPLALPRFDPIFGTLQAVEIGFQSDYEIKLYVGAHDDDPETFLSIHTRIDAGIDASVDGSLRVQLQDPSSSSTILNFPSVNGSCYEQQTGPLLDGYISCHDYASSGSSTYDALMPLGALGLTDFVGTDPINLFTALNGTFSGTCDSDDGDSGEHDYCEILQASIDWSGLVGVTYTYAIDGGGGDPTGGGGSDGGSHMVPEPGTNLLIAIGLSLLALLRRRPAAMKRA